MSLLRINQLLMDPFTINLETSVLAITEFNTNDRSSTNKTLLNPDLQNDNTLKYCQETYDCIESFLFTSSSDAKFLIDSNKQDLLKKDVVLVLITILNQKDN